MENNSKVTVITNPSLWITRTIASTIVKAKTYRMVETADGYSVKEEMMNIPLKGSYDKVQATEKVVKANPHLKIKVIEVECIEELRGMPVEDFIRLSQPVARPAKKMEE